MTSLAILSLGSNLGERKQTLEAAIRQISATKGVKLVNQSAIYESVALTDSGYDPEQPSYLNAVVQVETSLKPKALLKVLNEIENDFGRIRLQRWAPRTLDIDIITFGHELVETKNLIVPHPRAFERSFVLVPWLEIDPDAILPGRGRVSELVAELSDSVVVAK
ncbi:MAG TPA: 2-amino-4-hydroxy-6-hydroxymethyldihydropteridine diphosphokinase [Aquiluna sp.]